MLSFVGLNLNLFNETRTKTSIDLHFFRERERERERERDIKRSQKKVTEKGYLVYHHAKIYRDAAVKISSFQSKFLLLF